MRAPYMSAHRADLHRLLREARYVVERLPRTSRVHLQSRAQFANNRQVPPPPVLDRTWIYAYDATGEEPARARV
jgi:hypothetical protein